MQHFVLAPAVRKKMLYPREIFSLIRAIEVGDVAATEEPEAVNKRAVGEVSEEKGLKVRIGCVVEVGTLLEGVGFDHDSLSGVDQGFVTESHTGGIVGPKT